MHAHYSHSHSVIELNAESSRSHLVIGIVIESINKANGQVVRGKLSLVDLAGSERAAKTEANAEQIKVSCFCKGRIIFCIKKFAIVYVNNTAISIFGYRM